MKLLFSILYIKRQVTNVVTNSLANVSRFGCTHIRRLHKNVLVASETEPDTHRSSDILIHHEVN